MFRFFKKEESAFQKKLEHDYQQALTDELAQKWQASHRKEELARSAAASLVQLNELVRIQYSLIGNKTEDPYDGFVKRLINLTDEMATALQSAGYNPKDA